MEIPILTCRLIERVKYSNDYLGQDSCSVNASNHFPQDPVYTRSASAWIKCWEKECWDNVASVLNEGIRSGEYSLWRGLVDGEPAEALSPRWDSAVHEMSDMSKGHPPLYWAEKALQEGNRLGVPTRGWAVLPFPSRESSLGWARHWRK